MSCFVLTRGAMGSLGRSSKRFGFLGALASWWLGWHDRLARERGIVGAQTAEHQEDAHPGNEPELVEKAGWYPWQCPRRWWWKGDIVAGFRIEGIIRSGRIHDPDTKLFNKASKVAIARHDNKTVITMANDYQGDPREFALVVPVPTVLDRDQIHVTEPTIIDHLDAYTAPRLVEYFDHDPCQLVVYEKMVQKRCTHEIRGASRQQRRSARGNH